MVMMKSEDTAIISTCRKIKCIYLMKKLHEGDWILWYAGVCCRRARYHPWLLEWVCSLVVIFRSVCQANRWTWSQVSVAGGVRPWKIGHLSYPTDGCVKNTFRLPVNGGQPMVKRSKIGYAERSKPGRSIKWWLRNKIILSGYTNEGYGPTLYL